MGLEVNTSSGNLYIPRTDIFIPSGNYSLLIAFYYNSYLFNENVGFGNGWNFRYNIRYTTDTTGAKKITWGDGREDTYQSLGGGTYKTPNGFFNKLTEYQQGKLSLTEPDGVIYFFDNNTHRKVTRIVEPNGNYLDFTYTDTLLKSMANEAGQTISFTHTNGLLASVTDAIASPTRIYTYSYDAAGNLVKVTDPLNGVNKYSYVVNGPIKSVTDKNNNVVDIVYHDNYGVSELIGCNKRLSFSYDTTTLTSYATDYLPSGTNQVTKYEYKKHENLAWLTKISGNCCGFNMAFEFDVQGNKIRETDANGNVTSYAYDDRGNLLKITDALNQTVTYTYSADYNRITSFTDKKGLVTTLKYDARGNLVELKDPGNRNYTATYNSKGYITSSTDPLGNVFSYSYNAYGNPVSISGPNKLQATFDYDARGNPLSFTNAHGNSSQAEYDILDRLKKITDPLNNIVQLNYDAEGNAVSASNQNNERSFFGYDASNRLVNLTDAMGNKSIIGYDEMDNTNAITNALGHSMKLTYDNRNRLSGLTDPHGNKASIDYDAKGNLKSMSLPNGETITYTYDALDRVTSVSDVNGKLGDVTYDRNNNVTSYTNATGATTSLEYDNLNRLQKITDALGNSSAFSYDNNSRITSIVDRNGNTSSYTYDSLNRIKTYTDNNGFVVTLSYDAVGNITSVKDQNNNVTSYSYDALNRTKTITYADGKSIELDYDKKSNVTSKRLADGTTITFQYDTLDRMTTKTLPDGQVYSYAYDKLGRVVSASNNSGTVAFTYDELNRVVSETHDGRTVKYGYNISGRTQTTIYPDSTLITNSYDTRNRLVSIAKNNEVLVNYEYNNANQVTRKTFKNGVTTSYQYDFANRLSNISTANGSIQNTFFTYDKAGNKTSTNRVNNPALSEQFSYDKNYRLTNYKRGVIGGTPTFQSTYTYDALGNRTTANINGANTTYTSNNLNQLVSSAGSQNINFTYDNNGNRTFDGSFHKQYDAEGRLLRDSSSPANLLTYHYDALGRRIQKNVNGTSFKYTFSGLAPIEERDGVANSVLTRTVFADFLSPIVNERNNTNYYYHQNELNSVEAITSNTGNLVERYQYDPYGKPEIYDASNNRVSASLAGNRFMFTGQEYDSITGNYRFHFRNYSPETGTFNQRDLIGYADGMGMYQYVHNNPANGVDVLGLEDTEDPCYHDKDKIRLVSARMTLRETQVAIENANQEKNDVESGVFGFLPWLSGSSWITYGRHADSRFYGSQYTSDILANNEFYFMGRSLQSWEVNYYFTNAALQNGGFSHSTASGLTYSWNTGKALVPMAKTALKSTAKSDLGVPSLDELNEQNKAYELFKERMQEGIDKSRLVDKAFENNQNDLIWLSKEDDFEENEFGQFWPVINPRTGEIGREFFRKRDMTKTQLEHFKQWAKTNCPPEGPTGGTQKPKAPQTPGGAANTATTEVIAALDPNEIIGPDGIDEEQWVSVNDRLPYTILYENAISASAPAKYVRVTYPIPAKQDASTFQLSTFGFNSLTFTVPQGTSSYYQRLDARDSLGLYIDVTAGYDQLNKLAFWEFQSIDPVTLLPPADPLKGFLLLQDSTNKTYGHGFVNFTIKPLSSANTGDTIPATAFIIFDTNETIPTNVEKNTIDAVAPISEMGNLPSTSNSNTFTLTWSGADDAGGSGLKSYTLYMAVNNGGYTVYKSGITRTDTTFTGENNNTYSFFVLATDSAGNVEALRPGAEKTVLISSGSLPVTWLTFSATRRDKDAILTWAVASEINTKQFEVERSVDGRNFSKIGVVSAAGNSTSQRNYDYADKNVVALNVQTIYYRLKQVDKDGKYTYSSIVALQLPQINIGPIVRAYPNPFNQTLNIMIANVAVGKGDVVAVYTLDGKLLYQRKIGERNMNAPVTLNDLPNIPAGTYLLHLILNKQKFSYKVIKQ